MDDTDPIQDLALIADDKFFNFDGDLLTNLSHWDPGIAVFDGQRVHNSADDIKYMGEALVLPMPTNVPIKGVMPEFMAQVDVQQFFHPGVAQQISNSMNEPPPSVLSFQQDDDPGSVKPPKSRDRARHREVEQKYRNRINSKMDELCALLTPDGKPQMQKWTALDNAIKLIKCLRRQNEFLRNDSINLRAQVYTLQCALNRSMGVDFVPNSTMPPEQFGWVPNTQGKPSGSIYSSSSSPDASISAASDDIPTQKVNVPGPSSVQSVYSPPSPSASGSSLSPYSDGSNSGASGASRVSPTFLPSQTTTGKPVGSVTVKKVVYRPAAPTASAAIPQGRTMLACVLFSVLFFWNPFIAVSQSEDSGYHRHHGHDHDLERVFDSGIETYSDSYTFHWLSSTYIIAALIHVLLFAWLVARIFVLPDQLLSAGSESVNGDIDVDVKQHIRYAQEHIANGHYSVAFEELSAVCAIMGHPLPQTSLDVVLSFIWAVLRQAGHALRFGISITVWTVQFLAEGPVQPTILHRRLTTCASIQQRIVRLASSGKIKLPVSTKLALSLSSISLQEIAYALAPSGSERHWHHLLEDSYVTAGILILQLPLPVCFFARYYLFHASSTAKLFGSSGENRRFGWLYDLDSSVTKDLISLSLHSESAKSQAVFFENGKVASLEEPWSHMAWLRSRDLLTELLSCLSLSAPASSSLSLSSSAAKKLKARSVDSIGEYCLDQLEQIETCLRAGSSTSTFDSWLKLFRACHAWRRADHKALADRIKPVVASKTHMEENSNPAFSVLKFSLVAASLLPDKESRYNAIQRLLRSASALLDSSLHEDSDDIVIQFCRLISAEIVLSCRLNLAGSPHGSSAERRNDLCQAENCLTSYLLLLDRLAPNHPRSLMYRSRLALIAGESPDVAERFAKTALAITVDMHKSRVQYTAPNQSSINLLSAEAALLLALIRAKFNKFYLSDGNQRQREALQQAVQSFQKENSPEMAHLCSQLIGVE